jgi:exopolyphosphatase / guanosine-5'-triphosphate,3'-diphosphate pyrophosphatase
MDEEARATGGLDRVREPARGRPGRWGRRWPARDVGRQLGHDASGRIAATYAALDLGTNNCRLLVARPTADSFRVVDAFSRIIRLGEGLSTSGRISEAAIRRAIDALGVCRDKMQSRGVTRARLIATEACRSAENGADFCARISEKVGLTLEVVDRETEAGLAAAGCAPLIAPGAEGVVLFDIGGGSSELVRLAKSEPHPRGPPKPVIRGWTSLPVGVVSLAERHGGVSVNRALFNAMIEEVGEHVARFAALYGDNLDGMHMLGTSGTVTTIAGVHLNLPRYERRRVDGCWMTEDEVTNVVERLLAMSYGDRVASPCIGSERADLVLAGCAILQAIRRAFPCPQLRVADRGLREGILVQLMREDGVWGGARMQAS